MKLKWLFFSLMVMAVGSMAFGAKQAWRLAGQMPNGRWCQSAAYDSTHTTVFIIGGNVDVAFPEDMASSVNDSIASLYFKIDNSAIPLPEVVEWGWGPSLPPAYFVTGTDNIASYGYSSMFVYNNRLYFPPANTNGNPDGQNVVVMTDISTTGGLLGSWTVADSNPPSSLAGYLVFDASWRVYPKLGRVYRFGGRDGPVGANPGTWTNISGVVSAPINPDGTIGAWRAEASMPGASRWGTAEIIGDTAVVVVGYNAAGTRVNTVYTAQIDPATGVIGSWATSANPFPSTIGMPTSSYDGNYICVLTGRVTASTELTNSYRAAVNGGGTDIGPWEIVAKLPYKNRYGSGCGADGKFFVTGGRNLNVGAYANTKDIFALSYVPVVIGDKENLGNWNPANALPMESLTDNTTDTENHLVFKATAATSTGIGTNYKMIINSGLGDFWNPANQVGDFTGNNLTFTFNAATQSYYLDTRDLPSGGWEPYTNSGGNDNATTWVAAGAFQIAAGDTSDWKPDSTVTVMKDDGQSSDPLANDGIFTFRFVSNTALTGSPWKVVRQGGWTGATKFGTNGWSLDPGDSSNATITCDQYATVTLFFDQWRGHIKSTIVNPHTGVNDWSIY
ncbi:MAG: hypothetical protein NTY46_10195 [Candidatus Sumerlaeota bacterium]|nr:hypothetical protein [Candidatus Sumerlaeota bacterium]